MKIIFKLILALIIGFALYLEIFYQGAIRYGAFLFFTIQSNILVLFCLILFIFINPNGNLKKHLRGISLIAIALTCIVYNFILHKIYIEWGTVKYSFARTVTHVVAPIGFWIDWILFDVHNIFKLKYIYIWIIYPFSYSVICIYMSLRYGYAIYYFFSGLKQTSFWLAILLAAIILIGLIILLIDKVLTKKSHPPAG